MTLRSNLSLSFIPQSHRTDLSSPQAGSDGLLYLYTTNFTQHTVWVIDSAGNYSWWSPPFSLHAGQLYVMTMQPGTSTLFFQSVGSRNTTLFKVSGSGQLLAVLPMLTSASQGWIRSISVSDKGAIVLVSERDPQLLLPFTAEGIELPPVPVDSIARRVHQQLHYPRRQGQLLVLDPDSNSLLQVDVDSGSLLSSLSPDEPEVDFYSWMAWDSPARSLLLSNAAERDRAVQRVSAEGGQTLQLYSLPQRLDAEYSVNAMQADSDGRMWLLLDGAAGKPRQLLVLDKAGRIVRQQQLPSLDAFLTTLFVLSTQHDRLFVSCTVPGRASAIYIAAFSLSGSGAFNLSGFSSMEVEQMAVRPDGTLVLTAGLHLLLYNASTGLPMGNVSFVPGLRPLAVGFGRHSNELFLSVMNSSADSSGRSALTSSIEQYRDGQLVAVYAGYRDSSPLLRQLTLSDDEQERLFAIDVVSFSIYSWQTRRGESRTAAAAAEPAVLQRLPSLTWRR